MYQSLVAGDGLKKADGLQCTYPPTRRKDRGKARHAHILQTLRRMPYMSESRKAAKTVKATKVQTTDMD